MNSAKKQSADPFAQLEKPPSSARSKAEAESTSKSHPNLMLGRYDVKTLTDAEVWIEEVLDSPINERIEFYESPIEEVVNYLQDIYDIQILIDERALDQEGIGIDEQVTINIKNIKLRSALKLILHKIHLTCITKNEVLLITTPTEAETELDTRVYPINLNQDQKELAEGIMATIAANSWAKNGGGEGEIWPVSGKALDADKDNDPFKAKKYGGKLIISQTQAVHEEINQLFDQLYRSELK